MSEIRQAYEQQAAWGLSVSIDLHGCKQETVISEDKIRAYIAELCIALSITPTGDSQIADSGSGDTINGYSFCQFFPGGIISGHLVSANGTAFLDIFSPQYFDPESVASFAEKFFEAQDAVLHYVVRK
jgi:hypothetical protein